MISPVVEMTDYKYIVCLSNKYTYTKARYQGSGLSCKYKTDFSLRFQIVVGASV